MKKEPEAIPDPRIARAVAFIRQNFSRHGLSVHEIASSAGLSPFHFSRVFRAATGQSPHGYVLRLRLEEARRLLARGCRSIESIALACGYASHAHFTNSFGRHVGCTPAAYRMQQRAQAVAHGGRRPVAGVEMHEPAELSTA